MSVRVQDFIGMEIHVGGKVSYGGDEDCIAEVIAISDPDIYSHDDDYGREIVDGRMVEISIRFEDGIEETLRAQDITPWSAYADGTLPASQVEEIFEEPGDLEVVA